MTPGLVYPGAMNLLWRDRDHRTRDYSQVRDQGSRRPVHQLLRPVFTAEDIRILASPPQAPRATAICERIIGTLRRELFDRLLFVNEHHLRRVLTEYLRHYNAGRPHRALGQLAPVPLGNWIRGRGGSRGGRARGAAGREPPAGAGNRVGLAADAGLQVGIVSLRSRRNTPALMEILRSGAVARVGVSPVYTGLERTSQALHLARIALASSPAGEPMVNVFDDAPLPVLLVSSPTTSYRITRTILGPLLDINPGERDMLLNTLAAFFAFQGSAIEAGKHLYCHPNTVRHRLRRIERQTGRSLADPRSSAELFVALEALRTLPGPARGYA